MFVALLFCLIWGVSASLNESTWRWGPFRPNLLVGLRPTIPESLLMGLMWGDGEDKDSTLKTLRNTCEENDGLGSYGWTSYDPRIGGTHVIHDTQLGLDLTTEFVKSSDGESWRLRVNGDLRPGARPGQKTTVIFHVAMERAYAELGSFRDGRGLSCSPRDSTGGSNVDAVVFSSCVGRHPELSDFQLAAAISSTKGVALESSTVRSLWVEDESVWKASGSYRANLHAQGQTKPADEGNVHFLEAIFQGSFSVDFNFSPTSKVAVLPVNLPDGNTNAVFDFRVKEVFHLNPPFNHEKYAGFNRVLLSNLLGGLGFFHGDSLVDDSHAPEYEEISENFWEQAASAMSRVKPTIKPLSSLFSFSASRPIFPRGFLWDEGFHLLPVLEWDFDLAITVLQSWLALMDADGWIAREQILGPEARSKVPREFQTQYPHFANPPTLILLANTILAKATKASPYRGNPSRHLASDTAARSLLADLYPLLRRHYYWFRRTQVGNMTAYPRPEGSNPTEAYRWRGRTRTHSLTSGLDDYPRPEPPHPGELHVDALAWVAASAAALQSVAAYLNNEADAATHAAEAEAGKANLDILHWDERAQAYCDATITRDGGYTTDCHIGYISLLPLLLGLLPPIHPHLPALLTTLSSPSALWSPHGLRSLSAAHEKYHKGEDYWRGAVWMNINVLAILRLWELGQQEGPMRERARDLAVRLRRNVVDTVVRSWERTGFAWEQYGDGDGEGRRSRAFTGWTACVLLVMGIGDGVGRDVEGGVGRDWVQGSYVVVSGCFVGLTVLVFRRKLWVMGRGVVSRAQWLLRL